MERKYPLTHVLIYFVIKHIIMLFIPFMFPCLRFIFLRQLKVPEEGREGEPGTVRVSPANKTLFIPIRHRRLAGRDPTARRWSPKAKSIKPFRRPALPGLASLNFMLPRLRDEAGFSYPAYPVHPC